MFSFPAGAYPTVVLEILLPLPLLLIINTALHVVKLLLTLMLSDSLRQRLS